MNRRLATLVCVVSTVLAVNAFSFTGERDPKGTIPFGYKGELEDYYWSMSDSSRLLYPDGNRLQCYGTSEATANLSLRSYFTGDFDVQFAIDFKIWEKPSFGKLQYFVFAIGNGSTYAAIRRIAKTSGDSWDAVRVENGSVVQGTTKSADSFYFAPSKLRLTRTGAVLSAQVFTDRWEVLDSGAWPVFSGPVALALQCHTGGRAAHLIVDSLTIR